MKKRLLLLAVAVSLACSALARATVLPDACGDDKIKFDVKTQKDQPAPAAPDAGKAQIVFVEELDKTFCWGCSVTTRYGMDGAWVGANHGDSYFTLDVAPGEHHLCADWQSAFGKLKKKIGVISFTAEAGKVYYYEAKVTQKQISKEYVEQNLELTLLNEDEGKYRVKASAVSKSSPQH
jgi:hypothetical protein